MSQVMQYTFRIFGPNKGKSIRLGNHQFMDGICRLNGAPEHMGHVQRVLSYYGAFAMGTDEYAAALKAEEGDSADGAGRAEEGTEPGPAAAVSGEVQSEGGEPAPQADEDRGGYADGPEGGSGVRAEGRGREDAGVPQFEDPSSVKAPESPKGEANMALAAAVMKLDPENDEHWTKAGLPALAAVESAFGRAGVTRKDVEAAKPGWSREAALNHLAESL